MEKSETIEETALREVKEETGLTDVVIDTYLGDIIRLSQEDTGEHVEKIIQVFLMKSRGCRYDQAEEKCVWITFNEALSGMAFAEEESFLIKHKLKLLEE